MAKFKIQAALGDASVDMLSDMGSIPITFTKKKKKDAGLTKSRVFLFVSVLLPKGRRQEI